MNRVERKAAATLTAAVALGMAGLAGCATVPASPALTRAQDAYRQASTGPAARFAPVDVDRAWTALEQAQRLQSQYPGSAEADAQAYIALRRAELANVHAGAAVASIVRERAVLVALDAQTNRLASANAELQRTSTELSAALANRPSEPAMRHEQRGDVITVSGAVLFAHARADIDPAARETLNRVAALLRTVPDRHVVVEGFTDSTGDPGVNERLSVARADAVRKYLTDQGVDASRLSIEGFGARVPVATNATPEGRAANRRVEIVIQPRSGAAEPMPPSPPTQKKK
jgi:outer membrane protein OmpA-like peptidoglycan-associated protein